VNCRRFARCFSCAARSVGVALGVLALTGTCTAADTRIAGDPVTAGEVRAAISAELRARGVPEDQVPALKDIEIPAAVPAAIRHALRVVSVCWAANLGRAQFRLECREAGDCLPFLAYVRLQSSEAAARFKEQSCRSAPSVRRPRGSARKPVVRAGDRATIVLHASQMRLTSVVTCLDRGAEGDIIRVRNQDGRIFRARVSTATLLEALPE
jgi:hypothetical protein